MRLEARTSAGKVTTTELVTFSRPAVVSTLAEVGLVLSETKTLLAKLQAGMLCGQVAEYAAFHRACTACGALQPLKDRRTRRLQTLFGTVEGEAPRFKLCRCRQPAPMAEAATFSPVCALLTARCTPELERVQAELGARTSFRDGASILQRLLPVSPLNHESLRTRTHAVALQLEAADRRAAAEVVAVPGTPAKAAAAHDHQPAVMLDGAYIRAVPGHQVRNFEAICGKVEHEGHAARRFALVRSVTEQPHALLRAALLNQGWRESEAVTAISDGDPALPALVRSATGGPVEPILDWFHLSMRVHHVEQVMDGLCALEPPSLALPNQAQIDVERLRHLLWNGHYEKACEALGQIASWEGRQRAERPRNGGGGEAPGRALQGVAQLHRKQRGRADRLRPAPPGRQADLDLAGRGHRQPAGECPHEQAQADALVAPRRPSRASGQGRGAGRAVWPPGNPTRGVVPQVFDTPFSKLDSKNVRNITAASDNAEAFTAEVIKMLKAQRAPSR